MTEMISAEKAAGTRDAILHWVYYFATQGIIVMDTDFRVTGWNQWMQINTGRASDDVMGKNLFDLYPDLAKRRMEQRFQKAMEGQVLILSNRFHRYLIPIETRRSPGRKSFMEQSARIAPLINDGKIIGIITLIDDVTDRVSRERELTAKANELARSNSDLEQFAHIASHDLKEPLNKISSFSDLLSRSISPKLSDKEAGFFERIQTAIGRMKKLIDDILAYSRVGVSAAPAGISDLKHAVDLALGDLEIRIAETGSVIEVGRLPQVRASEGQLHQLFLNLIANAIKFSRPGVPPRITISAGLTDDGFVSIEVKDNGIGFEQQYADKIFMPFRRLHSRVAYDGSGIGLAVCKRIAELNGGSIQATGVPNEGAVFTVRLPSSVDGRAT